MAASVVFDVDERKAALVFENGDVIPIVSEAGVDAMVAADEEETKAVLVWENGDV